MKKIKKLLVEYSQEGYRDYPEDTWSDMCVIENENDLLEIAKYWHKESAKTFNNYPLNGLFTFNSLKFYEQEVIIDGDKSFYGDKVKTEKPEYFNKVKKEYENWFETIKRRLPKLQKLLKLKKQEEKDRRTFEELSKRFS